jgi:hypothetical protein
MGSVPETLLNAFGKLNGCLLTVCFVLCGGALATAQSTSTGDIRGTVTDPSGAVVPGALISVVNIDTGDK